MVQYISLRQRRERSVCMGGGGVSVWNRGVRAASSRGRRHWRRALLFTENSGMVPSHLQSRQTRRHTLSHPIIFGPFLHRLGNLLVRGRPNRPQGNLEVRESYWPNLGRGHGRYIASQLSNRHHRSLGAQRSQVARRVPFRGPHDCIEIPRAQLDHRSAFGVSLAQG